MEEPIEDGVEGPMLSDLPAPAGVVIEAAE